MTDVENLILIRFLNIGTNKIQFDYEIQTVIKKLSANDKY
jgi:hypothetical protein